MSVNHRARAYIHGNCAHCHNPTEKAGLTPYDMRIASPFSQMGLCEEKQLYGDPILPGALLIKPRDPDRSVVWLRMNSLAPGLRMPFAVSHRVDDKAVALIRRWIEQMSGCSD